MITYHDDMYLFAEVAFENGIINKWEYKTLQDTCRQKTEELRQRNRLEDIDSATFDAVLTLGGYIPYVGILADLASDPEVAQAACLDIPARQKISEPNNFSAISASIATKYKFKYTVYELYDDAGNVKYVGRTRQTLEARQKQHWKADDAKKGLKIQAAKIGGKTLEGLSYSEARGLEQKVFEARGGFDKLLNKIRPLDVNNRNPKVAKKVTGYLDDAVKFLKKAI